MFILGEIQVKQGMVICSRKIQSLLQCAEMIHREPPYSYIAIGLYTIAVEELGKLLLLQDSLKTLVKPDGKIGVDTRIFGVGSKGHTSIKFDKVLPALPDKCKKVGRIIGGVPTDSA